MPRLKPSEEYSEVSKIKRSSCLDWVNYMRNGKSLNFLRWSGMSIEEVQKIMGHDDVKTTKIYIKSLDNDKRLREGMKKLRNKDIDYVL